MLILRFSRQRRTTGQHTAHTLDCAVLCARLLFETTGLDEPCKVFERNFFHIRSIKHKLIIKLITELICKLRDEFIKTD